MTTRAKSRRLAGQTPAPEEEPTGQNAFTAACETVGKLNKIKETRDLTEEEEDTLVTQYDIMTQHINANRKKTGDDSASNRGSDNQEGSEEESSEDEEEADRNRELYFQQMIRLELAKMNKQDPVPSETTVNDIAQAGNKRPADNGGSQPAKKSKDTSTADPIAQIIGSAIHDSDNTAATDDSVQSDMNFIGQYFKVEDKVEGFSSTINQILSIAMHTNLEEAEVKALDERNQIPKNCSGLYIPQVDTQVWGKFSPGLRQRDVALQAAQGYFIKAAVPLLRELQIRIEERNDESCKRLSDTLKLLGMGFRTMSVKRKASMKNEIADEYKELCSPQNPVTEWLLGDDLSKKVTELEATNKVARLITAPVIKAEYKKKFSKKKKKKYGNSGSSSYGRSDKSFYKRRVGFLGKKDSSHKQPSQPQGPGGKQPAEKPTPPANRK